MSRIGNKPIVVPKDVEVEILNGTVKVTGTKGVLSEKIPPSMVLEIKDNTIFVHPVRSKSSEPTAGTSPVGLPRVGLSDNGVKRKLEEKADSAIHGLTRALIANMIKGVVEPFSKKLEIIGVGYKAQVSDKKLIVNIGYSHPVEFNIPEGIEVSVEKQTVITVKGPNKYLVGQAASEIRAIRPPDHYKGKGIRYSGEYVIKKAGKAAVGVGIGVGTSVAKK